MDRTPGSPPLTAGIEQEIVDLYEREAVGILRYAGAVADNRETAHDALQEAFFRYFLCRSAGQQIRSPKGWLFRVARNYVLDQKKAGSRNEVGMDSLLHVPCPAHHPETDGRVSDLLQGLLQIGLSPREIECVQLRTEELRYEEIAAVLGLQAGTVGALLARAHEKIRKAVGQDGRKNRDLALPVTREKRYAS
ncbi:MAG TPA: RNA polymerase sigma factor [Candidatus Acidoferrales bacterium]|jgi:RNA polymerase sigma factor (sigma-70 family)|nr:RNA polymerase sigma factor [Candidatus Acidoferrales bacterium]